MFSGSLKDLLKAVTNFKDLSLPLPDNLQRVVDAYIAKHSPPDEVEADRLQEELVEIYEKHILDHPARLAPFLRILRNLKPVLQSTIRSLQWWDKLATPIMLYLGGEKGLADEATGTLLDALLYDEDTEESRMRKAQDTSDGIAGSLLSIWLENTIMAEEVFDQHAITVAKQVQLILTEFGKKKPKKFLELLNKIFVKKESRISALALLCDFFRLQPPHLHELMQTPLFDNLLQCLQIDTSTRAISLGITALIMFLPHIPISASKHLPALFNIYSRLLFWDRERKAADILPRASKEAEAEGSSDTSEKASGSGKSWEKLSYLLESDDDSVPELLHYFTFLYGLYPLNFMDYVRKPQRYLRHAKFPGSDDLDIEPAEIRQRSEPFRNVHALHPNFFTLTIETELSDKTRWMKTNSADVVAGCMALYVPVEDLSLQSRSRHRMEDLEAEYNLDLQPLPDPESPILNRSENSKRPSLPEMQRTSESQRNLSEASQSMSMSTTLYSPSLLPQEDNATLPIMDEKSDHHLSGMLGSPKSTRSMKKDPSNDSLATLALPGPHQDIDIDDYLEKAALRNEPRSPTSRAAIMNDPDLKVKYLQREVKLMQNDLNFERYLSQQYQSHIGQMRSEQIQNTRAEAETQNLINTNRKLKSKVEELQTSFTRMRVENEKSKDHSRKWDAQVTGKLKTLREEQKSWAKAMEELHDENERNKDTIKILTNLVEQAEARELRAQQTLALAGDLDLIDQLRREVEMLKLQVTTSAAKEFAAAKAIEHEKVALARAKVLEMELETRDAELAKSKIAFQAELNAAPAPTEQGRSEDQRGITKSFLELTIAEFREKEATYEHERKNNKIKYLDLIKQHEQLLVDYQNLANPKVFAPPKDDSELIDWENYQGSDSDSDADELTSFDPTATGQDGAEPVGAALLEFQGRQRASTNSSASSSKSKGGPPTPGSPRSSCSNGSSASETPLLSKSYAISGVDETSKGSKKSPLRFFEPPQPFQTQHPTPTGTIESASAECLSHMDDERRGSSSSESKSSREGQTKVKSPKIGSESKSRQFGRGGPQNVGLKDKVAKQEAEHVDEEESTDPERKKAKRKLGIRGLRGFI